MFLFLFKSFLYDFNAAIGIFELIFLNKCTLAKTFVSAFLLHQNISVILVTIFMVSYSKSTSNTLVIT
jgi:hypothetical protein